MHSYSKVAHNLALIGSALAVATIATASGPGKPATQINARERAAIKTGLDQNHRAFVANAGQWDHRAQYRAESSGLDYWVRTDGVTFDYHRPGTHHGKLMRVGQVVKMTFAGSKGAEAFSGSHPQAHPARYMARRGGKLLSPNAYSEVSARNVYAGVDFRSYYQNQNLRYDFVVAPGADPRAIKLNFEGASKLTVRPNDVEIGTQLGKFAHGKLFAYQDSGSKRTAIPASFISVGGGVGFKLGAYDHSKPLVIDPVVYGSYFGGDNGWDSVDSVVADQAGNVFLTGWTQATTFPVTAGPYFQSLKGTQNAFIARLQGDAYNIDYSAFFGGSNSDVGQYVTVDQFNNVWIAGTTTSPDFPGNTKVHTSANEPNIFVMRWEANNATILDPVTHPAIQMIGFDGGVGAQEFLNGFTIVPDPNPVSTDPVILVMDGKSDQPTPEVTTGTYASGMGFLLRYSFDGTTFNNVAGATQYIGDGLPVDIGGVAVDNAGDMYVCGDVGDQTNNYDTAQVGATTFVTTSGGFTGSRLLQKNDLFIRKYTPTGGLTYSVLIGGSGNEYIGGLDADQAGNPLVTGNCIAVDSLGNAFITGNCNSYDYPRTRGAFGEIFDTFENVVVTKIAPDASQIVYSTNLKVIGLGEGNCQSNVIPAGIAVDQAGQAFITGNIDVAQMTFPYPPQAANDPTGYNAGSIQTGSSSTDPPLSTTYATPKPSTLPTGTDWLNVLDPTGTKLVYGTYLGGVTDSKVFGPYVDSFGDVWVNGWTDSLRIYGDPVSGVPVYTYGSLPNGMITPKAFKQSGDAAQGGGNLNNVLWGIIGVPAPAPPYFWSEYEAKDGWLVKMSIGRPIVSQVNLSPTTIPGGLGSSSQCSIVLSSAAPVQGAVITLDLLTPNLQSSSVGSFSSTSQVSTTTITIPGGATTTAPITIYSNAVNAPSQVLVRAYYQGNFLISPLSVIPWLENFTVTPSGTIGGNPVTGTVVLAGPAPTGGVTITLQSSSALMTPPATVTIAAGQQTAQFSISSSGVDLKSFPIVTASFVGYGIAQAVELDPASITSVVLNPTRVSGGTTILGTVTLNGLPGPMFPPTTVSIVGSPVGYIVTPGTLTFGSNGQATFTIQTPYETSVQTRTCQVNRPSEIGTDYTSQTSNSNFIVDPTPLFSFTLDRSSANPGDTANGTLSLSSPADANGAVVSITADSSIVTVPSVVTIPAGSTGATFPIPVGATVVTAPTTVTITATRGPIAIQQTLVVNPSTFQLSLDTNSVLGGNSVTGTITIGNPAPAGGLSVDLTFSPSGFASASTPVVIQAGQTSASFTISTVATTSDQNVTITASAGVLSSQQVLTVTAPSLTSISFTPSRVVGLRTTVCKLSLDGPAAAGGTVVTLSQTNSFAATLPTTVTIPAGKKSYAFTVLTRRVSRPITSTVTASTGSVQVSAVFTVVRY